MSDPFRSPPGTNPPRHIQQDRRSGTMGWALGAIAVAIILGVAFFTMGRSDNSTAVNPNTTVGQRTTADPPAINASPAPAPRVPAPAPQTTTGQSLPSERGNDSIGSQQPR